jgi:hypothetical protein
VGAGERSPSALRLEPSIVKERGEEAPRVEAGEPHSPVLLPLGGDFASFKDLFASRSPRFEPHSFLFAPRFLSFEPSEEEKKGRELHVERREELFASHSLTFEPPEDLFASHSPELERRARPAASSRAGGTSPSGGGTPPELDIAPCTSEIARQEIEGMPRELGGTPPDRASPWPDPLWMPSKIQVERRKRHTLSSYASSGRGSGLSGRHRAGKESSAEGLTRRIVEEMLCTLQHPFSWKLLEGHRLGPTGLPGIFSPRADPEERHPRASRYHQARHARDGIVSAASGIRSRNGQRGSLTMDTSLPGGRWAGPSPLASFWLS